MPCTYAGGVAHPSCAAPPLVPAIVTMTRNNQPDLYATLGVHPHASREQITDAYRTLVRRYHPDTRPSTPPDDHGRDYAVHDSPDHTRLQQVLAAYAVLHDPASRADYDHDMATRAASAEFAAARESMHLLLDRFERHLQRRGRLSPAVHPASPHP